MSDKKKTSAKPKAPKGLSQQQLVDYFTYAAYESGKAGEDAIEENKCYPDGQAFYSLHWYFAHLLSDDLSAVGDNACPLLLAYLYDGNDDIINPAKISKTDIQLENEALTSKFPQSSYPLNKNQIKSVHKALHYPVSIIKGPPGTGKTETIVRIAAMAVSQGQTVAIVSSNGAAVENVEQKLSEALNHYGKPSVDLRSVHEQDDLAFAAACKHVCLGSAGKRSKACDPVTGSPLRFDSGRHPFSDGGEITGWELNKSSEDFLERYPLITSTIHSLKKCFVDGATAKFDLLIMDEASQTNLVVGVTALSCAKRIVLVGDEEQLPPVITDEHMAVMGKYSKKHKLFSKDSDSPYDISRSGLSFLTSCYQMFSDKNPKLLTMLNEHFRCHPAIIGFCNEAVYDNKLIIKSSVSNADESCPIRINWYEGDYREGVWPLKAAIEEDPNKKLRTTCVNRKQLVIFEKEEGEHLRELARQGKTVCVLSPFRGQIYELEFLVRRLLKDIVADEDIAVEVPNAEEDGAAAPEDAVRALTIHKSQGQEFDTVYLLPVEDGNWEWPWSQGRCLVNVAASRAKEELIIILSTKLMEPKTQLELAGRDVHVKKPAKRKDDPLDQHMYVRRLVEYVKKQTGINATDDEHYGFHRTGVSSIFDEIPFVQDPKWRGKRFAPEACLEKALVQMNLPQYDFACNVPFSDVVMPDGQLLENAARERFDSVKDAHFDFVLYEKSSGRIHMVIEVDGGYHRFSKKHGKPDNTIRDADRRKNDMAREICHAQTCWLGGIRRGSLSMDEREDFTEQWAKWINFPSKLSPEASFIFLRIPSDGSTFCETNALRDAAKENGAFDRMLQNYPPPTIEEYLSKPLSQTEVFTYKGHEVQAGAASPSETEAMPIAETEYPTPSADLPDGTIVGICPECKRNLVMRTGRTGPNPGNRFIGCKGFPACGYTKNL